MSNQTPNAVSMGIFESLKIMLVTFFSFMANALLGANGVAYAARVNGESLGRVQESKVQVKEAKALAEVNAAKAALNLLQPSNQSQD